MEFEFQINTSDCKYVLGNTGDIIILKILHCLSEIQVSLGVLYVFPKSDSPACNKQCFVFQKDGLDTTMLVGGWSRRITQVPSLLTCGLNTPVSCFSKLPFELPVVSYVLHSQKWQVLRRDPQGNRNEKSTFAKRWRGKNPKLHNLSSTSHHSRPLCVSSPHI